MNPPVAAPGCGAMGVAADGAGAAEPAPKVKTPEPGFEAPNALAPPN